MLQQCPLWDRSRQNGQVNDIQQMHVLQFNLCNKRKVWYLWQMWNHTYMEVFYGLSSGRQQGVMVAWKRSVWSETKKWKLLQDQLWPTCCSGDTGCCRYSKILALNLYLLRFLRRSRTRTILVWGGPRGECRFPCRSLGSISMAVRRDIAPYLSQLCAFTLQHSWSCVIPLILPLIVIAKT